MEELKALLRNHPRIVFLGGAGVSTASGIPDFRSPQGLYKVRSEYGVGYETMLSHTYFMEHPDLFYDFYWKGMVYADAKPNDAHIALAEYEKKGYPIAILTQNIDGLHQKAGSKKVYELHGSTERYFCEGCRRFFPLSELERKGVPHCPSCGAIIKPDVVLYEEPLDEAVISGAIKELLYADVLIVGGTSLSVYPAAGLISYFGGKTKILINKERTPLDEEFDYVIHDDVGKVLKELLHG